MIIMGLVNRRFYQLDCLFGSSFSYGFLLLDFEMKKIIYIWCDSFWEVSKCNYWLGFSSLCCFFFVSGMFWLLFPVYGSWEMWTRVYWGSILNKFRRRLQFLKFSSQKKKLWIFIRNKIVKILSLNLYW